MCHHSTNTILTSIYYLYIAEVGRSVAQLNAYPGFIVSRSVTNRNASLICKFWDLIPFDIAENYELKYLEWCLGFCGRRKFQQSILIWYFTSIRWSYPNGQCLPLSVSDTAPFSYVTMTTTCSLSPIAFKSGLKVLPCANTVVGLEPAIHEQISRSCTVESTNMPPGYETKLKWNVKECPNL